LFIHAERNQTNITKNDRNENVGHNHTLTVQNDFTMHVGYEKADPGSYVLNVCQDRIESVSNGDYNLGVDTGNRNTFIKTDDNLKVTGNRNELITNSLSAKAKNVAIKGTSTFKAESPDVQIVGSTSTKIGSAIIQVSGSTVSVTGTTEVTLAVGGSSIKINAGGITITGPMVKINT
jgi:type VI secretion system secreted protein VgrG